MPIFQLRLAGYGLLVIGMINLIFAGTLAPALLRTVPGRLAAVNSLIGFAPWLLLSLALIFVQGNRMRRRQEKLPLTLLHRLLRPLMLGYLLLVPLMIYDATAFNGSVKGEISRQLSLYRQGSGRLLQQVRPLTTPMAVAQVVQRYPNIAMAVDPTDTTAELKAKLTQALNNGQARLETRLDDLRRSRLEGLYQRTIAASGVALVAAMSLGTLLRQNVAIIPSSGNASEFFAGDLFVEYPGRRRSSSSSSSSRSRNHAPEAIPEGWLDEPGEGEASLASTSPEPAALALKLRQSSGYSRDESSSGSTS